jgi:hypothetical protein
VYKMMHIIRIMPIIKWMKNKYIRKNESLHYFAIIST